MEKKILLDANSIIHRVYHALPFLQSPQGIPTNAIYGITNILLRIIDEKPDYLIACFDSPAPTFRHLKSKEYKATRPKTPDDLKIQLPLIKKLFALLNIPVVEKLNYEADDLIGSLLDREKLNIIISGDLDTLQLVDKNTIVYFLKKGITEIEVYDEKKVEEKYGISPKLLPDLKALVGDPSDNIIGIKGIGPKTAIFLLKKYGGIERIIESAEQGLIDPTFKKLILENRERLLLNKELTTINRTLNIDLKLEKYQFPEPSKLLEFFKELGFKSIIERITKKYESGSKLFTSAKREFSKELKEIGDEIFLIALENTFYLKSKENFYQLDYSQENLQKILQAQKIIIFDLKTFFKNYYKFFGSLLDEKKFFDLKIALWLSTPLNKITLEKLANYYSTKVFTNEKEIILFILENFEKIYTDLANKIKELDLENVLHLDQKTSLVLAIMELNGILLNLNHLEEFKAFLKNEIDKNKKEIYELAGVVFNINSPIELRNILFSKLKLPTKGLKKTPKGEISTQESELLKLLGTHPIIEKIILYRENAKILNTFIANLLKYFDKDNKRIKTNFEITGSATGRISSEEPNLQNIPIEGELARKLRKCFVSEDNFSFLALDYSQIELRIAAHFSQDLNLINIFQQDLDIHSITAKLLFKEENEKTRRYAKIINFGILYGISAKGLSERTGLSLTQSKDLIKKYFQNFPGVKKMIDDFIEKAKNFGYAETILGRKRLIPEIYSRAYGEQNKAYRIAINTPIQGTAADILKLAMIQITEYIFNKKLSDKVRIVLQIHDELIFEVEDDIIEEIKEEFKKIMENVIELTVPLKVKSAIGKTFSELK